MFGSNQGWEWTTSFCAYVNCCSWHFWVTALNIRWRRTSYTVYKCISFPVNMNTSQFEFTCISGSEWPTKLRNLLRDYWHSENSESLVAALVTLLESASYPEVSEEWIFIPVVWLEEQLEHMQGLRCTIFWWRRHSEVNSVVESIYHEVHCQTWKCVPIFEAGHCKCW